MITISYDTFMLICGIIITLSSVAAILYKIINPFIKVIKDSNFHSGQIENLELMCKIKSKAMIAMINHMIDGNGVESMKSIRDELQQIFIDS